MKNDSHSQKINHSTVMKDQLWNLRRGNFGGRINKSGWKRIPSVEQYKIFTNDYNEILARIGINLRTPPSVVIQMLEKNEDMNNYMHKTIHRIRKLRDEKRYKEAWFIIIENMFKSTAFRLSALQHVFYDWYFAMSESEFWMYNRKASKIIGTWDDKLKYKRVYIPKEKPDGTKTWRPLGVPTKEWRLVLHMWTNFMQIMLEKHMLKSQHGFIPGRGTMSAWQEILNKVITKNYIYECDLKQFFPSVSVLKVVEVLNENKFLNFIKGYIINITKACPELPKEEWLDESKYKNFEAANYWKPSSVSKGLDRHTSEFIRAQIEITRLNWLNSDELNFFLGKAGHKTSPLSNLQKANMGFIPGGFPQGAPSSPLLSILALKDFLSQQPSVSYADDPIFYSDKDFTIKDYPMDGIVINEEKSGWIKREGVWLKDLKFLGLVLTKDDLNLRASTRKGAKGGIPELLRKLIQQWVNEERITEGYGKEEHLAQVSKRNIFGFMQACLYKEDWENSLGMQYRTKGISTTLRKIHKKSWLNCYPENTDSSSAMEYIAPKLRSMLKKNKKPYLK